MTCSNSQLQLASGNEQRESSDAGSGHIRATEGPFPFSLGRDARAIKDSCQLARLASRRIQLLSRGSGGVPSPEHKGSLGPSGGAKGQGSASMPAGEDEHRSQRRSWTRDSASHSQRTSGADPCIAPAGCFSVAGVGSQSLYLYLVRSFRRRRNKIELNETDRKDESFTRSLPRLCNYHLSVARRSDQLSTEGSGV